MNVRRKWFIVGVMFFLVIFSGCSATLKNEEKEPLASEKTVTITETPNPIHKATESEAPVSTQTSTPTPIPSVEAVDESYLIPDSNSRYLDNSEAVAMDENTRQMAINELYARHGRKFNTPEIQEYFNQKAWYVGSVDPELFDESVFNEYEKFNIEILKDPTVNPKAIAQDISAANQTSSIFYFPGTWYMTNAEGDYIEIEISLSEVPEDSFATVEDGTIVGYCNIIKTEYFPNGMHEADKTDSLPIIKCGIDYYNVANFGDSYLDLVPNDGSITISGSGYHNLDGVYFWKY